MTSSATLRHNAGEAGRASIGNTLASKRLERGRPGYCALRGAERSMSAIRRGKQRRLSLARAAGVLAGALAASLAWAGSPESEPDPGGVIPLLAPEAPATFGP